MDARRAGKRGVGASGTGGPAGAEAEREVLAVYAELEGRAFPRDCRAQTTCCRFRLTGKTPQLTRGEALVAARALRAHGRKELPEPPEPGSCPLLRADGRCRIYEGRPFGCRTHFCQAAGGVVERGAVLDLIRRLEAVDEGLRGEGPLPLAAAVAAALAGFPSAG